MLILDAFDEMKSKYQKENLYQLGELYQWQIKVIISCRSEALVSIKQDVQQLLFEPYHESKTPLKVCLGKKVCAVI